ncbi:MULTISPECIES: tRNA (adenosine(37)-N6)-dimethylallyltransferase MiaA [unclassified Streptococcus]|uniref:tRNA (adenosine(37)-N6)-dimethylallyltransferase MiaA n=1 Tax=unclassified Streptococcus TaxID=2608887 RepID=UPI0018A9CA89|nr:MULTISPECIES: tRNA (adenosine(37)-N6)-dimethylallyltransferase MiaA [unclassified Streptococcus]MBF8969430.1 tRNA (adenosine(37)-N6)-dimethylallyltransferase MiaA [Streptococcus sp. NLN76]MBG9366576.1 tRNA (adenosine(37)-N6)-dimethylallyltransferase MiaA [Streptococcus sp. NLN64]
MKTKLIVIMGPTAVGKSALGIELAQKFNGEIISGDSQQVYRSLDIGTAKVTRAEQELVPHHLLDVREVDQGYSAFDFVQEATIKIEEIAQRGALPMIVGGTGLYLQSLLEGYHLGGQLDQAALLAYRQELEALETEALYELVNQKGISIREINRRRATRALELDKFGQDLVNQEQDFEALLIALDDDREVLYQRINQRVDEMVEDGLLEEARWLYNNHPQTQAARGIGYKELFPYFEGETSLESALDTVKKNTRHFAKRQLTWFRNRMKPNFFLVSTPDFKDEIQKLVEDFLND